MEKLTALCSTSYSGMPFMRIYSFLYFMLFHKSTVACWDVSTVLRMTVCVSQHGIYDEFYWVEAVTCRIQISSHWTHKKPETLHKSSWYGRPIWDCSTRGTESQTRWIMSHCHSVGHSVANQQRLGAEFSWLSAVVMKFFQTCWVSFGSDIQGNDDGLNIQVNY
jgi:hypothetical protein